MLWEFAEGRSLFNWLLLYVEKSRTLFVLVATSFRLFNALVMQLMDPRSPPGKPQHQV